MSRIVLNTSGSLGDLHPYLAIGAELRRRGHEVVLASHPEYRERAEAEDLAFAPIGVDIADLGPIDEVMRHAMARRTGSRYVLEKLVIAHLRRCVDDLLVAAEGCDLMVGHVVSLAGPIVAERLRIPRVHSVLQPFAMFSVFDPPTQGVFGFVNWLHRRGPATSRVLYGLARVVSAPWFRPVNVERQRLGLAPTRGHPLFDMWTPGLNLALFSPLIAPPQPDWPEGTLATGFPMQSGPAHEALPGPLREFLDAGEPPIVFTLGSAAVFDAGGFYTGAARAASALGVRAVLLTGSGARNPVRGELLSERVVTCEYVPHGPLFARAAAIVHQGGMGTTARALASGRPMLVMPYSHDQPDNARRCVRLGVARVIERERWDARAAELELRALLGAPAYAASAREVAAKLAREDGSRAAADALERRLETLGS